MAKTFDEVKAILNTCDRYECRDHAFGDREVFWERNGEPVAEGYFGRGGSVWLLAEGEETFGDKEAYELVKCGRVGGVSRNDSTGPDNYTDGACMPGLTLEGVRKELCGG